MKYAAALFALVPLSGCIPPGTPPPGLEERTADREADPTAAPRIEPEFETLFDEAPVWEMRPVKANAVAARAGDYVVQPGDTLRSIGEKTGAGSEMLARSNDLSPPYIIRPGQVLRVPEGRFHKVSAGETGIAIAQAYRTRWQDIIERNGLTEPFTLQIGQRLLLPEATEPNDATLEARARAFTLDIDAIVTGGEPAIGPQDVASEAVTAPRRPLAPTVAVAEPKAFSGGFVWPAAGRVTTRFGPVGEGNISQGIDIAVAQAAEILAAGEGVVAFVGDNVSPYGGLILVRHGDGWITAYGRVAEALVTRGQKVSRGQPLARAGSASAPTIFFQIRKNRVPVDPLKQLPWRS